MIDSSDFRTKRMPLNHGAGYMPVLGFGTLIPDAAATISATRDALEAGFRHFDCAERYRNEREVAKRCRLDSPAAGDANAEHDIYDEDAICDYPQSGERILGRRNLQALRSHHPEKPAGFNGKRILGRGDLWITEYTVTYQGRPAYTVSIMKFRNGKVVHETQYFADPFEAPAWRSQWIQQIE